MATKRKRSSGTEVLYLRVQPEVRERLITVAAQAGVTISAAANALFCGTFGIEMPEAALVRVLRDSALLRDTPNGD